MHTNQQKAQK